MRPSRSGGWRTRWLALTVALALSGCAPAAGGSPYRVSLPTLRADPTCYALTQKARVPCPVTSDAPGRDVGDLVIVVYWTDWAGLVRELRGACLALGGTATECGTEP